MAALPRSMSAAGATAEALRKLAAEVNPTTGMASERIELASQGYDKQMQDLMCHFEKVRSL